MPRKNNMSGYSIVSTSLAADFDTFSNPTNVDFLDNVSLLLKWDIAGLPIGEIQIFVSNFKQQSNPAAAPTQESDYAKLDFGAPILIGSSETSHIITLNQFPFSWIALKYIRTSGTGSITAKLTAKEI